MSEQGRGRNPGQSKRSPPIETKGSRLLDTVTEIISNDIIDPRILLVLMDAPAEDPNQDPIVTSVVSDPDQVGIPNLPPRQAAVNGTKANVRIFHQRPPEGFVRTFRLGVALETNAVALYSEDTPNTEEPTL